MRRVLITVVGVGCLIATAGCGNDRPPLAPVSGTVTFQGEPLLQGTIVFEIPGCRPATGKIVGGQIVLHRYQDEFLVSELSEKFLILAVLTGAGGNSGFHGGIGLHSGNEKR